MATTTLRSVSVGARALKPAESQSRERRLQPGPSSGSGERGLALTGVRSGVAAR